ncbi:hypothetical protein SAMN04488074_12060 [Lentzea albidocapillata subsp. violacea]|uniref:Uncharacterized protein n=1 Tax=Lentzea albidocapillata subsp. violacea TaxID=128104 RepID=A0A1G9SH64_9PSEU|nr:hypothetical protein [Lentzea albidocapillata]SDM34769.1 hypothetical protein SAMN04488074_12060 [Lentzea albidocapillata subsp. violacea]
MRWSKGWIVGAGVFSVVAAIGGTAFALAGSGASSSQPAVAGKEVCTGQQVKTTNVKGPATVLSDKFPVGTLLRITNPANGRAITVSVTGPSTGCAVLNTAAFDSLGTGEAESVLRRMRVEIVGNAPAPAPTTRTSTARVRASGTVGQVVCDGATVGLSAVGGAPGAFSSQLPVGTAVRVTNLDNGKQTTIRVVGVGPACVVLNSAAFELVGESGKNVIKRVQIEKVT